MADSVDWVALAVFLFFFILVTVMGLLRRALEIRTRERAS